MKTLRVCILVVTSVFLPVTGQAYGRPHPILWIKHHKFLFVASAIIVGSDAFDIQSTLAGERRCSTCFEGNPLYGRHPSAARIWSTSIAIDAGVITLNSYMSKDSSKLGKTLVIIDTSEIAALHSWATYHNSTLKSLAPK